MAECKIIQLQKKLKKQYFLHKNTVDILISKILHASSS